MPLATQYIVAPKAERFPPVARYRCVLLEPQTLAQRILAAAPVSAVPVSAVPVSAAPLFAAASSSVSAAPVSAGGSVSAAPVSAMSAPQPSAHDTLSKSAVVVRFVPGSSGGDIPVLFVYYFILTMLCYIMVPLLPPGAQSLRPDDPRCERLIVTLLSFSVTLR
ncbi:hypothetical protein T492DRAFT_73006 [Pavlovales sp. CCMP2436]|nr:hypothetical protein T492DRAFT_73006 [Pavlovales sp. CCMP2436]